MNCLFRVDSASFMGIGHVMRCLTLAKGLREKGSKVVFVSKDFEGNINKKIKEEGFELFVLNGYADYKPGHDTSFWLGEPEEKDSEGVKELIRLNLNFHLDWIIVDHYGVSSVWERAFRNDSTKILVLDDLANREHYCDILLDQTLHREKRSYQNLVNKGCRLLLGSKFMLLRKEFYNWNNLLDHRITRLKMIKPQILIMMGGSDPGNLTFKIVDKLRFCKDYELKILVGKSFKFKKMLIEEFDSEENIEVIFDSSNVSKIMYESDISIGAAGTSSWERCIMGLPSLLLVLADNQELIAKNLEEVGAARKISINISSANLKVEIDRLLQDDVYQNMVQSCIKAVGRTGPEKILKAILEAE